MRRSVRHVTKNQAVAVLGAALALGGAAGAGCSADDAGPVLPAGDRSGTGVLTTADLPAGYRPAADHGVFAGLRATDADCARLLRLADGGFIDASPAAGAVFYSTDPPASLAHRVYRSPDADVRAGLATVRTAAERCPAIELKGTGDDRPRLRRSWPPPPGDADEAVAVRYAGGGITFDMVWARVGAAVFVLAHPVVDGEQGPPAADGPDVTERLAAEAVRRLRATTS